MNCAPGKPDASLVVSEERSSVGSSGPRPIKLRWLAATRRAELRIQEHPLELPANEYDAGADGLLRNIWRVGLRLADPIE